MITYNSLENFNPDFKTIVTIGTFDGVHFGHKYIIEHLNKIAQREGGQSVLLTFDPHPRHVLYEDQHNLKLLNSLEEKKNQLEELGLNIKLLDDKPIITQQIFSSRGISFVSFTYRSKWDGELSELVLQSEEISEAAWFLPEEAASKAVSHFDVKALNSLR